MYSATLRPFCMVLLMSSSAFANTTALRLQNSQYVSSGATFYREDAGHNNSSISLSLDREQRWRKNFGFKAQIKDEYSATENWNYLNIYQSHLNTRLPAGLNSVALSAGRKIETWSSTEDDWKIGVFQPRYVQNKLRPETAGLTGFFFSAPVQSYLLTVGVLPIFVPDLGCHFWVDNNKFTSKNPWFDPPAPTYLFRDQNNDIHYSANKPTVEKVLANPGLSAKIEKSGSELGTRFAAAYKPVPQLLYGFPSLNKVVIGSTEDYLSVAVTPRVVYHWVASTDIWRRQGQWTLGAGLTHDHPVPDQLKDGWTSQTFSPAWIWSFSASRPLEAGGTSAARIKFGLLKIEGGLGRDRGEFARQRTLFEGRFQYNEAYMAGLMFPLRGILRSAIDTEAKVIFDRIQNGGAISLSAGYNINRDWRVDGDVDILGLAGNRAENENGFFSSYRANDRMGMGMTYVF